MSPIALKLSRRAALVADLVCSLRHLGVAEEMAIVPRGPVLEALEDALAPEEFTTSEQGNPTVVIPMAVALVEYMQGDLESVSIPADLLASLLAR